MGDEPKKAMKKAGAASGSDRMRRFSAATGAKIEETEDGAIKVCRQPNADPTPSRRRLFPRRAALAWRGTRAARAAPRARPPLTLRCRPAQAHNPFLEMLSEEEEEEDSEDYVEEMAIELVKGPGGFGMDITEVSPPCCPSNSLIVHL